MATPPQLVTSQASVSTGPGPGVRSVESSGMTKMPHWPVSCWAIEGVGQVSLTGVRTFHCWWARLTARGMRQGLKTVRILNSSVMRTKLQGFSAIQQKVLLDIKRVYLDVIVLDHIYIIIKIKSKYILCTSHL